MPIGLVREGGGSTARPSRDTRNQWVRQTFFEDVAEIAISVVGNVLTVANRVLEPEIWTRWQTASDEKVCPICGPYAGRVWKESDGPQPPLHADCRCQRVYAFTTWTVRD